MCFNLVQAPHNVQCDYNTHTQSNKMKNENENEEAEGKATKTKSAAAALLHRDQRTTGRMKHITFFFLYFFYLVASLYINLCKFSAFKRFKTFIYYYAKNLP